MPKLSVKHWYRKNLRGLHGFLLLWLTQSLSALGSSMTGFALVLWSYQARGSALSTALLSVCSYAPYVVMSVFAGALSDRWNKKATMLLCDSLAALTSAAVLVLAAAGRLQIWQLYGINALNGLMNTLQQPAADVAVTLLTPPDQYQRVSGLRAFSNSLVTILSPAFASALFAWRGLHAVVLVDLFTFSVAFLALLLCIRIPAAPQADRAEPVLQAARAGLRYLWQNRGVLDVILFLAAINLIASVYNAALPAMVLPRAGGGQTALGVLNTVSGAAMLAGSLAAIALPKPKSRVRVICNTLLVSMGTENFLLALGRSLPVWCLGSVLGWLLVPLMNTNLDALLRSRIPVALQGRVYAARNALQFFTIPVGYLLGGVLVDWVFEPFMAARPAGSPAVLLFGSGKGSGAAMLFFVIAFLGVGVCLFFRRDPHLWQLEKNP